MPPTQGGNLDAYGRVETNKHRAFRRPIGYYVQRKSNKGRGNGNKSPADIVVMTVETPAGTTTTAPVKFTRSRAISDPLTAINKRSAQGRAVYDLTCRWLKQVDGDASDPLVIAAVIAAAELSLRCDAERRDSQSNPDAIVRLENALSRRLRSLGVIRPRSRGGESKLTRFA